MLTHLHHIGISQTISSNNPLLATIPAIVALSAKLTPEDTQLFYQIGLKGTEDLHLAPTLAIGFEMMLLRMYTFRPAPRATTPPLAYQTTPPADLPAVTLISVCPESPLPADLSPADKKNIQDVNNLQEKASSTGDNNWGAI